MAADRYAHLRAALVRTRVAARAALHHTRAPPAPPRSHPHLLPPRAPPAQGADALAKLRAARVLVIGAGGIGCELLKDLVLTGFEDVELVDLDTIDVSNLNRQFLFRPQHVGQPKAVVAREAALLFNPAATIVAHHA